ncbi:MAG TPA: glycosyltransferase, partial [Roseomonas sp.]
MLRVLTISTLFPNGVQPNFGVFVGKQTQALAAQDGVEVRVVNPIPMPPFPLSLHSYYRPLHRLPAEEDWQGVRVARPRMLTVPGISGPFNPTSLVKAARPIIRRWRDEGFAFDVIDAQFFYPDGPAAARLAAEFGVPLLIKARGDDIHYWGARWGCGKQIMRAASQAASLLSVSKSLARDMAAMGMDAGKIAVHYTGCDLDRFRLQDRAAAKAKLGVQGPLVVSLGALIPRKGHDLVIEALAGIPDVTLFVVGEGPEQNRLAGLVQAHGLQDRVRLIGSLPHGELPDILGAADVMALASESEGL